MKRAWQATLTFFDVEADFVSYATVRRVSFCFAEMKKCDFAHDLDARTPRPAHLPLTMHPLSN
jgi:hypothetical protein